MCVSVGNESYCFVSVGLSVMKSGAIKESFLSINLDFFSWSRIAFMLTGKKDLLLECWHFSFHS